MLPSTIKPSGAFLFRHPAHLLSLGFGTGLSPLAPGTVGTLFGWLAFHVLTSRMPSVLEPHVVLPAIAIAFLLGIVATHVTGRALGAADHGSIVWDEIVAVWLVLTIAPSGWIWEIAGVLLFRLFDIWKPAPIRQWDARLKNGFGVMVDDLIAAGYVLLVLAVVRTIFD